MIPTMKLNQLAIVLSLIGIPTNLFAADKLEIKKLSFGGDGCNEENSIGVIDSVNQIVKFLPGNMTLNLTEEDELFGSVSCLLRFQIAIPHGMQIAISQDRLSGYQKITGQGQISVFMNGRLFYNNDSEAQTILGGKKETSRPYDRTFIFSTFRRFKAENWSTCGQEKIEFVADSDIIASKDFETSTVSKITLDSAWVYRVHMRDCQ